MAFSVLFSVDECLHTLFACVQQFPPLSVGKIHADYLQPPHGLSVVAAQIICVGPCNYPRLSTWNNHRILWEKLTLPCHIPYICLHLRVCVGKGEYLNTPLLDWVEPLLGKLQEEAKLHPLNLFSQLCKVDKAAEKDTKHRRQLYNRSSNSKLGHIKSVDLHQLHTKHR